MHQRIIKKWVQASQIPRGKIANNILEGKSEK